MHFNQLKENSVFEYMGHQYTVLSLDPPNVSLLRTDGDSRVVTISYMELVSSPSFQPGKQIVKQRKKDEKHYLAVLDTLPDKQRDEVTRRFEIIRPLLIWDRAKQNDTRAVYEFMTNYREYLDKDQTLNDLTQLELLEKLSRKFSVPDEFGIFPRGCSVSSIKRYLSAYRKAENELSMRGDEALVTRQGNGFSHRKDNRTIEICHPKKKDVILDQINVRIGVEYVPIIKEAIEKEYLTLKRKTKSAVYEYIETKCHFLGVAPPSKNTIMKLLGRIDPQIRTRMRDGNKAAESYDPVTRGFSNEEAQYPLHIVEIDHTELDLDVIDEKTGYVIGRPWITLGIDVYSRMVWCMYVSFEPPSANVVRKAIQQGIFFKRAKEKFGTINEWDVFGIPNIIYMDNGPEFRNAAVKRMITETLKSNVRYRPVKTPRFGGTIERLFGTINKKLIHLLHGTRKSNPIDLGEYDPDKEAVLTLEDVRTILTMYITDQYHMIQHRGLPLDSDTPIVRYLDGLRKTGYPDFITEDQEEAYTVELLPVIMKPYTRDGIRLNNVLYKLDSLSNLIAKSSTKYKVKYDIDDISKVYLQIPRSGEYVLVPATQPAADELYMINWYTWKKLREIMREESNEKRANIPGTKKVVEAKLKMKNMLRDKYKSGRKVRQQAARMNVPVTIGGVLGDNSVSKNGPSIQELMKAAKRVAKTE